MSGFASVPPPIGIAKSLKLRVLSKLDLPFLFFIVLVVGRSTTNTGEAICDEAMLATLAGSDGRVSVGCV